MRPRVGSRWVWVCTVVIYDHDLRNQSTMHHHQKPVWSPVRSNPKVLRHTRMGTAFCFGPGTCPKLQRTKMSDFHHIVQATLLTFSFALRQLTFFWRLHTLVPDPREAPFRKIERSFHSQNAANTMVNACECHIQHTRKPHIAVLT